MQLYENRFYCLLLIIGEDKRFIDSVIKIPIRFNLASQRRIAEEIRMDGQ